MRTFKMVFVALVATLGLLGASGVQAQAAPTQVKIQKIANVEVALGATAVIVPSVRVVGSVEVISQTLTISQKQARLLTKVESATLGAGRYKVVTKVKYRTIKTTKKKTTYSKVKTKTRAQKLRIVVVEPAA
ncbi:hypothetical protein BH09ACT10_BH09ACT10_10270 [soil metagenome]